ncbi:MAG: hypothetical protein ACREL9_01555 [Gemmatimonadales bacterium]
MLLVVLGGAILITVTAIFLDSPLGRTFARRFDVHGDGGGEGAVGAGTRGDVKLLQQKVELLEGDLDELNRTVSGMRDEIQFVQRLLEDPTRKKSS